MVDYTRVIRLNFRWPSSGWQLERLGLRENSQTERLSDTVNCLAHEEDEILLQLLQLSANSGWQTMLSSDLLAVLSRLVRLAHGGRRRSRMQTERCAQFALSILSNLLITESSTHI